MPVGNPNAQTIASKKYQKKAGYVAKSFKLKQELVDRFKAACDRKGESMAAAVSHFMEQYAEEVENGKG